MAIQEDEESVSLNENERTQQRRSRNEASTHSERVKKNETEWHMDADSKLQSMQAQSIGPNPAHRERVIEETSGFRRGRSSR